MQFSNPDDNVRELGLKPNQKVVIFGSGAGGHTLAVARALKGTGTIYGIDSRAQMIERLKKEVADRHHMNVRVISGSVSHVGGSGVNANTCDAVIIPDTLFSSEHKENVFTEAYRILSYGAKLLVVDWAASFKGAGPQPEHIFEEADALKMAKETGFVFERRFNAGNYHYALIFHKPTMEERKKV